VSDDAPPAQPFPAHDRGLAGHALDVVNAIRSSARHVISLCDSEERCNRRREHEDRAPVYTVRMPDLLATAHAGGYRTFILIAIAAALAARSASAQCHVVTERASLERVTVSVPGQRFALDLAGVPVIVELKQPGKGTTSIEVQSPLRFTASYPSKKLVYRIRRDVELFGGRIHLGKQAGHTWLRVRGDGLQLSLKSALGLEVKEAVIVPCNAVELGNGTAYAAPLAILPPKERTIGTGPTFFPLYLAPQEVDPLEIRYSGPFQVLQRRPGWVLLQADWEDASQLRGWTRERFATFKAMPTRSWGEVGGSALAKCGGVVDGPPPERVTLRKGAVVAASPGGAIWASAAQEIAVDAILVDRADNGWIHVTALPGLPAPCLEHEHIWVHERDVIRTVPQPASRERSR